MLCDAIPHSSLGASWCPGLLMRCSGCDVCVAVVDLLIVVGIDTAHYFCGSWIPFEVFLNSQLHWRMHPIPYCHDSRVTFRVSLHCKCCFYRLSISVNSIVVVIIRFESLESLRHFSLRILCSFVGIYWVFFSLVQTRSTVCRRAIIILIKYLLLSKYCNMIHWRSSFHLRFIGDFFSSVSRISVS